MSHTSGVTTIRGLIQRAVAVFESAGVESPLLDAEVLLAHCLESSRTFVIAHLDDETPVGAAPRFSDLVRRRSKREPLAYIIGEREFYGLVFEVSPAVLVPRPETELLVETVLSALGGISNALVAEIGVGSGAVAVSIAAANVGVSVHGTDCSIEALEIARRNAERHGVAGRVHLSAGCLLEPLAGMAFDGIVSNPPYIPTDDIRSLEPEIAEHEPRLALDGGPDGLTFYRRLIPESLAFLKDGGFAAVEVGAGQSGMVGALFTDAGFEEIGRLTDYGGIERVVCGRKRRA